MKSKEEQELFMLYHIIEKLEVEIRQKQLILMLIKEKIERITK